MVEGISEEMVYLMTDRRAVPRHWWIIKVGGGYGEFNFFGTEKEAEEMRCHKAQWEHVVAWKRRGRRIHNLAYAGTRRDSRKRPAQPEGGNRYVR